MNSHKNYYQLILTLALLLDRDGDEKLNHSIRTAIIAAELAKEVIPEEQTLIFYSALLHDVGGVGLPHHIVHYAMQGKKSSKVMIHPIKGSKIIERLPGLKKGSVYVRDHHERWDGKGYPEQKKGDQASLGGQIIHLADQIDLKIRSFGRDRTGVYNYFRKEKGKIYNPELWPHFLNVIGTYSPGFFHQIVDTKNLFNLVKYYIKTLPELSIDHQDDLILQAIRVFSTVIDAKHPYTQGHSHRVAEYSATLGSYLGLNQELLHNIKVAGYLHDLGKIAIPLSILDKKSDLSNKEYKIIKSHVLITMEILDYIPFLRHLSPIAGGHHERWDGRGYPDGLKGEEIHIGGRIMALADVLDALTSDRSYRKADPIPEAAQNLLSSGKRQFDPDILNLLKIEAVIEDLITKKKKIDE